MSVPEDIQKKAREAYDSAFHFGEAKITDVYRCIGESILAERDRCARIAAHEAESRLLNEGGYPAVRVHDFIVVARKIEKAIRGTS